MELSRTSHPFIGSMLFDLSVLVYVLEQLPGRHGDAATRPILQKEVQEKVEKEAILVRETIRFVSRIFGMRLRT
ncbi:MAG: hypothetical protein NQU46_04910 [Methanolinea sp.]|nr:hypothetical protein [Methanolinea sp.]